MPECSRRFGLRSEPKPALSTGPRASRSTTKSRPSRGRSWSRSTATAPFTTPTWKSFSGAGGVDTVVVSGVTTENCCHATARDALFRDYKVVFLSDATGTFDYPDVGQGAMSAAEVHKATLSILSVSTAHVMKVDELIARVKGANKKAA